MFFPNLSETKLSATENTPLLYSVNTGETDSRIRELVSSPFIVEAAVKEITFQNVLLWRDPGEINVVAHNMHL